mmetsp:Transcript_71792/g.142456  ORF Transcript_71792/g.142456 Transcript_71792/m.142456 type:complete len:202 (+) Transcript_71792:303-908(+)
MAIAGTAAGLRCRTSVAADSGEVPAGDLTRQPATDRTAAAAEKELRNPRPSRSASLASPESDGGACGNPQARCCKSPSPESDGCGWKLCQDRLDFIVFLILLLREGLPGGDACIRPWSRAPVTEAATPGSGGCLFGKLPIKEAIAAWSRPLLDASAECAANAGLCCVQSGRLSLRVALSSRNILRPVAPLMVFALQFSCSA